MLLHIIRVIFILLEVLILFNLLIVVHELGHFLAARWRGLYIEKFGVWFGKPLWKKTINGVQYSLGSLPFGGFVALPQLAPMDIIEGKADIDRAKLPKISALDKIIVAIAGPLFSLLLALCFAAIVWAVGHPVSEASWDVVRSEGDKIAVKFQRDGAVQTVWVEPYKAETRGWRRKSVRQLLIYPAETPIIDKVEPNTPAAAAGLRSGDIVRGFNQTPIYNPIALLEYISKHPNDALVLHVERAGAKFDVPVKPTLLPTAGEMKPRIGIQWDTTGKVSIQHPNPIEQDRSHLLSAFPKRTRLATGAVVQRHSKCEPGDFEHVTDSSARWRPHCAGAHRIGTAQTGEHARAGGRADQLRGGDHRLHALYHVLRCAGSAVCQKKT